MLTDLGYYYNYDKEKMQVLEGKLNKLSPNEFLKLFLLNAVLGFVLPPCFVRLLKSLFIDSEFRGGKIQPLEKFLFT